MTESSAVMESVLAAIQEAEWPGKSVAEFLLFASQKDQKRANLLQGSLDLKTVKISTFCGVGTDG
jgi:hypothetical protein